MKKFLMVCMVMFLSSCVQVNDLGTYANKTFADPQLKGIWKKIAVNPGDTYGVGGEFEFEPHGAGYNSWPSPAPHSPNDKPEYFTSLKIGPYYLLIEGQDSKFMLIRYETVGNTLKMYTETDKLKGFLKDHYSEASNFSENDGFKVLDDATAKFITTIPNNDQYWKLDMEYTKE